ncbi:MAG: hypothetical protein QY323_02835 [Patescibacteria group bacterium]|nr:MAG: hypothetical protein QY323_02835 [Patescibacteria group bacterium]
MEPWHLDLLARARLPGDLNRLIGQRIEYACRTDGSDRNVRTIRGVAFGGIPDDDPVDPDDRVEAVLFLILSDDGPSRESRELFPALRFDGARWTVRSKDPLNIETTVVVLSVRFP